MVPAHIPEIATVETRNSVETVDASAVFFFRGNFTRRWLPSEISVISVRRFIHVKKKEEKIGKNGNDVTRSSQKDFIDHRMAQRNNAYPNQKCNIHECFFNRAPFDPAIFHGKSSNHHYPFIPTHTDELWKFVWKSTDSTRGGIAAVVENLPTKIRQLASIVWFRMSLNQDQPCRTVDT